MTARFDRELRKMISDEYDRLIEAERLRRARQGYWCPACDGTVTYDGKTLECRNPDCPSKRSGYDYREYLTKSPKITNGTSRMIDLEVIRERNGVLRWFLNGHGPASMLTSQDQVNAQFLIEANDIDALLAEVERKSVWISVADRLPGYDVDVITFDPTAQNLPEGDYRVAVRSRFELDEDEEEFLGFTDVQGLTTKAVTHWMPLPEPPND